MDTDQILDILRVILAIVLVAVVMRYAIKSFECQARAEAAQVAMHYSWNRGCQVGPAHHTTRHRHRRF